MSEDGASGPAVPDEPGAGSAPGAQAPGAGAQVPGDPAGSFDTWVVMVQPDVEPVADAEPETSPESEPDIEPAADPEPEPGSGSESEPEIDAGTRAPSPESGWVWPEADGPVPPDFDELTRGRPSEDAGPRRHQARHPPVQMPSVRHP